MQSRRRADSSGQTVDQAAGRGRAFPRIDTPACGYGWLALISVANRIQASGDISLMVLSIGNGTGVIAALIGRAVASAGEGGSMALGQTSETKVQVAACD